MNIDDLKIFHKVSKGETLQDIAYAYEVSVEDIISWNKNLSQETDLNGKTLIVSNLPSYYLPKSQGVIYSTGNVMLPSSAPSYVYIDGQCYFDTGEKGSKNLIRDDYKGAYFDCEDCKKHNLTPTLTASVSPTATESPSESPTATESPSVSPTATESPSESPTATESPSESPTATESPTVTESPTITPGCRFKEHFIAELDLPAEPFKEFFAGACSPSAPTYLESMIIGSISGSRIFSMEIDDSTSASAGDAKVVIFEFDDSTSTYKREGEITGLDDIVSSSFDGNRVLVSSDITGGGVGDDFQIFEHDASTNTWNQIMSRNSIGSATMSGDGTVFAEFNSSDEVLIFTVSPTGTVAQKGNTIQLSSSAGLVYLDLSLSGDTLALKYNDSTNSGDSNVEFFEFSDYESPTSITEDIYLKVESNSTTSNLEGYYTVEYPSSKCRFVQNTAGTQYDKVSSPTGNEHFVYRKVANLDCTPITDDPFYIFRTTEGTTMSWGYTQLSASSTFSTITGLPSSKVTVVNLITLFSIWDTSSSAWEVYSSTTVNFLQEMNDSSNKTSMSSACSTSAPAKSWLRYKLPNGNATNITNRIVTNLAYDSSYALLHDVDANDVEMWTLTRDDANRKLIAQKDIRQTPINYTSKPIKAIGGDRSFWGRGRFFASTSEFGSSLCNSLLGQLEIFEYRWNAIGSDAGGYWEAIDCKWEGKKAFEGLSAGQSLSLSSGSTLITRFDKNIVAVSELSDPLAEIKKDIQQKAFAFSLNLLFPTFPGSDNFLFGNGTTSTTAAITQKSDRIGSIPDAIRFNELIHLIYLDGDVIFITNKIAGTKIFIKTEPSKSETQDLETSFTIDNGAKENETITVGSLTKGNYYYAVFNTAATASQEAWFFGKITVI